MHRRICLVLLVHVYEKREGAMEGGAAAARAVHARWTWDHTAQRIIGRLREIHSN